MKITLNRELKVALLEAVKNGEIDTEIFPTLNSDPKEMQLKEIATETVRLHKINRASLQEEAALMIKFANNEITTNEYIDALTELWQTEIDNQKDPYENDK